MTDDEIRERALAEGFKRKLQPDGTMDLSPCVFNAIRACQPQWISVDERLPVENRPVAVAYQALLSGGVKWFQMFAFLEDERWYKSMDYFGSYPIGGREFASDPLEEVSGIEITHWMPLPEPPKNKGE